MTPSAKDQLVRDLLVLENSITNPKDDREICYTFHIAISKLLSNDGITTILNPSPDTSNFDFMCTKQNSRERICISLQNTNKNVIEERVHERVSFAFNYPYDRLILFGPKGFTTECYRFVNVTNPLKVELLTLDDLKSWTSRIEVESDQACLEYEDIIKIVSKTFIEKIANDTNFLLKLEWRELEKIIAEIFEGLAFDVKLTAPSKDGGKDLILEINKKGDTKRYLVEVKHWKSKKQVGQKYVKEFVNVICNEKSDSGLLLSTYGFTPNAFEGLTELERKSVRFGNEEKIVSLCKTYLKVKSGIWTPLDDLQEIFLEQTK
ncbi:restriction endonuclease [Chryseobacterium sp. PET-29]|uniref:restriction endonuclease n=1 Tax=Chryseobacterium sp. PET-29 TaxID=2983267 RepID=UPI0021E59F6F|nr:restriction endonuclease [Chryseobacterium sp. PET-29]